MIYICPGTVFWWEFNGGVHFHTRLTNFGNFPNYHMCIWFIHCFSMWIQWLLWLCNHEGVCEHSTWYGYHLALISILHSTRMVIWSIRDHYYHNIWYKFTFKYLYPDGKWFQMIPIYYINPIMQYIGAIVTILISCTMRNVF